MSERRKIWKQSIEANSLLLINKEEGEKKFRNILHSHPEDGMVYYERAEGFEFLCLYEKAIKDYRVSMQFLDVEHWKNLAADGITRVTRKINHELINESEDYEQWGIFHRLHFLNNIDALTKYDTYIAMTLYDSEPRMTALLLRCSLETILLSLLPTNFSYKNNNERRLEKMIDSVKTQYLITPMDNSIFEDMDIVRQIGNDAAHPSKRNRLGFQYFKGCVKPFINSAEWANRNL